ncbi:hypothetical protein GCM10025867_47240 (plasmid) [Frondihabitans sucicola]|uniref:Fibronectin type-III domain-containing protein n=1 Tax=Frondihabitans sucicola TaxID=1268041 RepID=A0ABM8GVI5_9MICO|nr:hypothetical protein [Frondihabitans sucicola]BDZ52483.1 hypothetical protein GCM10025867_47240 [Frondihabitans sucicola]
MNLLHRLRRDGDKGVSLVTLLVGMGLIALIMGAALTFYVTQSKSAATGTAHQKAQSSLVTLSNRVVRDVQVAAPLVYASPTEIIVETDSASGAVTLTRYAIDVAGHVATQQVMPNASKSFDPVANASAWDAISKTTVASNLNTATNATTGLPASQFSYYQSNGGAVTVGAGTADTSAITRVGISLASTVEKTATGAVQVSTFAALRNKTPNGDIATAVAPACPPFSISTPAAGSSPVLTWGGIAGVTEYHVFRDGVDVKTIAANGGQASYSYTDTVTGSTGNAITYRVLAASADGTMSTACQSVVWSPPAATPVVTANVFPDTSTTPAEWDASGATQPYMTLSWGKVDGASGYTVERREVDTTNYQPLTTAAGSWVEATKITDITKPTYTFSTPGYGRAYEFYVEATSRTGNSLASNHVKLLSAPAAPTTDTPTPTDYNVNAVNWTASPTATGYAVYRYPDGATPTKAVASRTLNGPRVNLAAASTSLPQGATLLATVGAAARTYSDTTPELGTKYAYFVAAINSGPRDQTGVNKTRYSATPTSAATAAPRTDSALQFPPDPPTASASGSEANALGTNKVTWASSKSATSYQVRKFWPDATTRLLDKNVGNTLSFSDTGNARGTQNDYYVLALNATGVSPNAVGVTVAQRVTATQLPDAPTSTITAAPSLSSNAYKVAWNDTGDAGNPSSYAFCNTSSCKYQVYKYNGSRYVASGSASYALSYSSSVAAYGSQDDVYVVACNAGGCSDNGSVAEPRSYPGPFSTGGQDTVRSAWRTNSSNDNNHSDEVGATLMLKWGDSAGAAAYTLSGPGAIYTSGNNGYTVSPALGLSTTTPCRQLRTTAFPGP